MPQPSEFPSPDPPRTGAAILAGGLSRRMGANKALLRLQPGKPMLIESVVGRLEEAGLADGLLLVANSPDDYAFLELPIVPDEIPGTGPLGGILTALLHSPFERVLVVACDMPYLNPALLAYIAHLPDTADVLIPRWISADGQTRLETLHAVYSRRCIPPIQNRIAVGARLIVPLLSVHALLEHLPVRYVAESELRTLDPDLRSFHNINTPDDVNYEL